MTLKLCACLAAGALIGVQAFAAPTYAPFFSVDLNGYSAGSGQSMGPTEPGFQAWETAEGPSLDPSIDWGNSGLGGLTKVFPTSEGNIMANLIGVPANSIRGARNRGANLDAGGSLTQDLVFAQRNSAFGLGQNYVKLTLSGLAPSGLYEVTTWARDPSFSGPESFQAWSDRITIGVDGPGAWLDANVSAGASYQPAPGGTMNPVPRLARSPVSGPANNVDAYAYAASFLSAADATGVLTVYGWADPETFSGAQAASLLNGFQVGAVPQSPPGDFNQDAQLDLVDYLILSANLFADVSALTTDQSYGMGDMNRDKRIDGRDFVGFRSAYDEFNGVGAFVAMLNQVPEPTTAALAALASGALIAKRRLDGRLRHN